jgi:murein L,D-transpeptidase YcbB/YkuD
MSPLRRAKRFDSALKNLKRNHHSSCLFAAMIAALSIVFAVFDIIAPLQADILKPQPKLEDMLRSTVSDAPSNAPTPRDIKRPQPVAADELITNTAIAVPLTRPPAPQTPPRRVGITLPQPTHHIIELTPRSKLIEPKPLYEGVALEVPGQKRVPQEPILASPIAPQSSRALSTPSRQTPHLKPSQSLHRDKKHPSDKIQKGSAPVSESTLHLRTTLSNDTLLNGNVADHDADITATTPQKPAPALTPQQEKLRLIQDQLKGVSRVGASDQRPVLTPETYLNTLRTSDQYLAIAESGGWPTLPAGTVLSPGARNASVVSLKQRLMISGDLDEKDAKGDFYDDKLMESVKRFQERHGLTLTGTVSGATLDALNVPARTRYRQLKGTAERLAQRSFGFGGRYLIINLAASSVEAIEEGRVKQRFKAILGSSDRPTPVLESMITSVTLNPEWTAPAIIVEKDILPRLRQNPQALPRLGLKAYDQRGVEVNSSVIDWTKTQAAQLTFRHSAGAGNPLGRITLNMSAKERVALHDTLGKRLSLQDERNWISGSVQINDIRGLTAWILNDPNLYSPRNIQGMITTGQTQELRLNTPMPVKLVYMTGYVTDDGHVHFRPDPYGLDDQQRSFQFGE